MRFYYSPSKFIVVYLPSSFEGLLEEQVSKYGIVVSESDDEEDEFAVIISSFGKAVWKQ